MSNDSENVQSPPPWRNPWLGAALAGMLFVTVMRPCTRREPPPPISMGALPVGIGHSEAPISSKVPTILGRIQLPCGTECEATLQSLEQLVEGHASWETPVIVRVLVEDSSPLKGTEYSGGPPTLPVMGTREACESLTALCGDSDAARPLILVDPAHDVRGCYPATAEGTKEAFHRSVRTWQDKVPEDPSQTH